MKKIILALAASFGPGSVLGLTDAQAAPRSQSLNVIRKGIYEVVGPVQFKAGEEVAIDGELPKHLEQVAADPRSVAEQAKSEKRSREKHDAELVEKTRQAVFAEIAESQAAANAQLVADAQATLIESLPDALRAQVLSFIAGETTDQVADQSQDGKK